MYVLFFFVFEEFGGEDEVLGERCFVGRERAVLFEGVLVVGVVFWVEPSEDAGQDETKVEVGSCDSAAFGEFAVGFTHSGIVIVETLESVVCGSLQFGAGQTGGVGTEDEGAEGFDAFVLAAFVQEMGKAVRCCFLFELARGEVGVEFL